MRERERKGEIHNERESERKVVIGVPHSPNRQASPSARKLSFCLWQLSFGAGRTVFLPDKAILGFELSSLSPHNHCYVRTSQTTHY